MNYLVNPSDVVKFDRNQAELQTFYLFCATVAGKTATTQARLLNNFLLSLPGDLPFDKIRRADEESLLHEKLRLSRLGQYNRLARMFRESLSLDLQTCTIDDLEAIHGCGPKTARMFLMHSRPNQRVAALDTHVLKLLRDEGHVKAPLVTPSAGPRYRHWELIFLDLADASGMSVADYDLVVWKRYSSKDRRKPAEQASAIS